jgi:hypothetical protein
MYFIQLKTAMSFISQHEPRNSLCHPSLSPKRKRHKPPTRFPAEAIEKNQQINRFFG